MTPPTPNRGPVWVVVAILVVGVALIGLSQTAVLDRFLVADPTPTPPPTATIVPTEPATPTPLPPPTPTPSPEDDCDGWFSCAVDRGGDIVSDVKDTVVDTAQDAWSWVTRQFGRISSFFVDKASDAWSWIRRVFSQLVGVMGTAGDSMMNAVKTLQNSTVVKCVTGKDCPPLSAAKHALMSVGIGLLGVGVVALLFISGILPRFISVAVRQLLWTVFHIRLPRRTRRTYGAGPAGSSSRRRSVFDDPDE